MILNSAVEYFYFYVFIYFFIYNVSALTLFWAFSIFMGNFNSLFLIKNFQTNIYLKIFLSIIFLSIAGLPPFLGFFTKIFVINYVILSQLTLNVICYFILILMMLFFYIQNFKIIFSISNLKENPQFFLKSNYSNFYIISNYMIIFLLMSPISIDLVLNLFSFLF